MPNTWHTLICALIAVYPVKVSGGDLLRLAGRQPVKLPGVGVSISDTPLQFHLVGLSLLPVASFWRLGCPGLYFPAYVVKVVSVAFCVSL